MARRNVARWAMALGLDGEWHYIVCWAGESWFISVLAGIKLRYNYASGVASDSIDGWKTDDRGIQDVLYCCHC